MHPRASLTGLMAWACCMATAPAAAQGLAADRAAIGQLVNAVSLDVMTEASLSACDDLGAPSSGPLRAAWVAWREKHQLPQLKEVLVSANRRNRFGRAPDWDEIIEPMRARVLADPAPDKACDALVRDLQAPGMDVAALYPQAAAAAMDLVRADAASRLAELPATTAPAGAQVLLPTQIAALAQQHQGGWDSMSADQAQREHGFFYVKGRVKRWGSSRNGDFFGLFVDEGERTSRARVDLDFNAEAWVGREVVVRGVMTSLRPYAADLKRVALVANASSLLPSPLAQEPLRRKDVLLQRVMRPPGRGLADKDLAAIVIEGKSNFNNGTTWEEDVRFLLRDGTVYHRTEMPPDQLDVTASRKLEPQQWGRWRTAGKLYEMQAQDVDGRPTGEWKGGKHHPVKPWLQDTRLEGYFSRSSFSGSLITGGVSSRRAIRFSRDGRFERSASMLGTSGSLAAINGANIASSSHSDGQGSSSTMAGSVGGSTGTVTATGGARKDDGASRRGRYRLSGFVLELDYDDGHRERLLSFPVYDDGKTIYVGSGSLRLDK